LQEEETTQRKLNEGKSPEDKARLKRSQGRLIAETPQFERGKGMGRVRPKTSPTGKAGAPAILAAFAAFRIFHGPYSTKRTNQLNFIKL